MRTRLILAVLVVVATTATAHAKPQDNEARAREVATACTVLVSDLVGSRRVPLERRAATCQRVALIALGRGVDMYLALSLAWHESKFKRDAVSRTGRHFGALQVDPTFCCPNGAREGCDLVVAGVDKIGELAERYEDHALACCHYNGGVVCGGRSRRWGRLVASKAEELRVAAATLLRTYFPGRNDGERDAHRVD